MPALTPSLPLTAELLPRLFLGDGSASISFDGLRHFALRTVQIVQETAAAPRCIGADPLAEAGCDCGGVPCPQGSAAREAGKEQFAALVRENMWIPTAACVLYILFVFCGPKLVKQPQPVKPILSAWNLAMSIFSALGSYHCMGALAFNLYEHGFRYTVCQLPKKIDMQGFDLDIWVCFFVLSKIAEFFDTVLKILLKRPFIFLHWYHHAMTAWLGWLSLAYDASAGQWYAGLNFTVHAPMYFYYFLSSILDKDSFRKYCRPIAPCITGIQILQMIAYVFVNTSVWMYYYSDDLNEPAEATEPRDLADWTHDGRCHIQPVNLQMNAFVTVTYLVLFSSFFHRRYVAPTRVPVPAPHPKMNADGVPSTGHATTVREGGQARRRSQRLAPSSTNSS